MEGALSRSWSFVLTDGTSIKSIDTDIYTRYRCWGTIFKGHKDDDWVKEKDINGDTRLLIALEHKTPAAAVGVLLAAWPDAAKVKNRAGQIPLQVALNNSAAEENLLALIAIWPEAAELKVKVARHGYRNEIYFDKCRLLHLALMRINTPAAAVLALLAAWPDAVKEIDDGDGPTSGNTALHYALSNENTTEAVVAALFSAYPEAIKVVGSGGSIPLDFHILPGVPAEVVAAYRQNLPDDGERCRSFLSEGKHLDEAAFLAWFAEHAESVWIYNDKATRTRAGECTSMHFPPLHFAVMNKGISKTVVAALVAACPDAIQKTDWFKNTPLFAALHRKDTPEPVIATLVGAWPDSAKAPKTNRGWNDDELYLRVFDDDDNSYVGNTPLHTLGEGRAPRWNAIGAGGGGKMTEQCTTHAERRHACALCFTLVKHGASLAATNASGKTPAAFASAECEAEVNHHLIATFREIALFQLRKHAHLSLMHFRDWTTVSHAWCTPSAKLVALTVLMVGETYKRRLLPRLPMDCWYRILNCIPRHELRLAECKPAEERTALALYEAIVSDARTTVDRNNAAAAAAAAAAVRD